MHALPGLRLRKCSSGIINQVFILRCKLISTIYIHRSPRPPRRPRSATPARSATGTFRYFGSNSILKNCMLDNYTIVENLGANLGVMTINYISFLQTATCPPTRCECDCGAATDSHRGHHRQVQERGAPLARTAAHTRDPLREYMDSKN